MKFNSLRTFLILSFFIFGCKKDKTAQGTKSLVGHWYSMFNYQWYGEVILNADGTGEIIHYPPYSSSISKTSIEWTSTDTSFCWSYLGSVDKCMSYYKILHYSKDSVVIYQNTPNGWYAELTKTDNYTSHITTPLSCGVSYYYDSTLYDISKTYFDPSLKLQLNNNRQVSVIRDAGYYSRIELYNGNFNLINNNVYSVSPTDTSYNTKSINNSGAFTGQFFPFNYNKRGGFLVAVNQKTIITIPNSDYCSAELINDNNIVVGKVKYPDIEKIYFYNNSTIDTVSIPFQHDYINLIDINNNFILASYGNYSDNIDHYFKLYFNKSVQALDFSKEFHFYATNNLGQIAGVFTATEKKCSRYPFIQYNIGFGLVLEPDNTYKLYGESNKNYTFLDINDNGDILGRGNDLFLLKKR